MIENTLRIVRRIEKTHLNLGLPTVFAKLIDVSNLGEFLVGDRGRGKTTILDMVTKLRHRDVLKISIITWAGIAKMAKEMDGRSLTMINPDLSSFYTDYLKDVGVSLIANLITEHMVKAKTGRYELDISDCYLSFISATQPKMLRNLCRLPTWESMYKDRFLRFHLLYPFGTPTYREFPPNVGEITYEIASPENVLIPKAVKKHKIYTRLKAIIERQTSEGRCGDYTDRLLKAHAWLNNRDCAVEQDLEIMKLFLPNLALDFQLSERRDVSAPLVFDANSYLIFAYLIEHGESSKKGMRAAFNVSHSTITRNFNPLMATNLVKGTYGQDLYRVNPKWYELYITPILEWRKEYIV